MIVLLFQICLVIFQCIRRYSVLTVFRGGLGFCLMKLFIFSQHNYSASTHLLFKQHNTLIFFALLIINLMGWCIFIQPEKNISFISTLWKSCLVKWNYLTSADAIHEAQLYNLPKQGKINQTKSPVPKICNSVYNVRSILPSSYQKDSLSKFSNTILFYDMSIFYQDYQKQFPLPTCFPSTYVLV